MDKYLICQGNECDDPDYAWIYNISKFLHVMIVDEIPSFYEDISYHTRYSQLYMDIKDLTFYIKFDRDFDKIDFMRFIYSDKKCFICGDKEFEEIII